MDSDYKAVPLTKPQMFLDCENTDIVAFKRDKWSFNKRTDYLQKRQLFSEDQTQLIAVGRIEDRDVVV